jgi:hypothetical protein
VLATIIDKKITIQIEVFFVSSPPKLGNLKDVCDLKALPVGREADLAGFHVSGELRQPEGGATQQAGDRSQGVAGTSP